MAGYPFCEQSFREFSMGQDEWAVISFLCLSYDLAQSVSVYLMKNLLFSILGYINEKGLSFDFIVTVLSLYRAQISKL